MAGLGKKNLNRDKQVLMHIYNHQMDILNLLNDSKCRNKNDILNNKRVIDLISFYVLQIYEVMLELTEESRESLVELKSAGFKTIRNQIVHNYSNSNRELIIAYMYKVSNDKAIKNVKERYNYCTRHSRNR